MDEILDPQKNDFHNFPLVLSLYQGISVSEVYVKNV